MYYNADFQYVAVFKGQITPAPDLFEISNNIVTGHDAHYKCKSALIFVLSE